MSYIRYKFYISFSRNKVGYQPYKTRLHSFFVVHVLLVSFFRKEEASKAERSYKGSAGLFQAPFP